MRVVAAGIICLLSFLGFSILEFRYSYALGINDVARATPLWLVPLLVAIMTFLGVLGRSIYEVVTRPNGPKTYSGIFAQAIGPNRLLLALVISPIVIGLFYKSIRSTDDLVLTVVSAFQNGFFWKSILRNR